ncbi:MAG: AMP-binding protein [Alphaproteobacteria bacterium]
MHPKPAATYEEVYSSFRWDIPERYNIAADVCDRHAATQPDALALIFEAADGQVTRYSFRDMQRLANRAANLLAGIGIAKGDRVGILLGQGPETAAAHLACWKLGAISVPLYTLFEMDALRFRLGDCGAKALLTDRANYSKIVPIRDQLPDLGTVLLTDGAESGADDFHMLLERARDSFATIDTDKEEPAFLIYTSGTTGQPKGALHAHRGFCGQVPGFDVLTDFFGQDGDIMWSPADWAWIAGLMDVLMPAWRHGKPVLAFRTAGRFDPEAAMAMMARHEVRNALLVPTMLKLMRQVPNPPKTMLRSLFSGGESVGADTLAWAEERFGIKVGEGYGQTECNMCMGHLPKLMDPHYGSLGRVTPGHVMGIVDDEGNELPAGEEGHIAFARPDPVMLLEYWNNPQATAEKYAGDWLLTGDRGVKDEDGFTWFVGRTDDVITSSGYRIGPGEIEDCLLGHPAVRLAAVVGVPDPVRTESIKAFVVPADGHAGSDELVEELRAHVRARLARHEVPRAIEFIAEIPVTASGKVIRRELRERELAHSIE